jgi:hypothetical protein
VKESLNFTPERARSAHHAFPIYRPSPIVSGSHASKPNSSKSINMKDLEIHHMHEQSYQSNKGNNDPNKNFQVVIRVRPPLERELDKYVPFQSIVSRNSKLLFKFNLNSPFYFHFLNLKCR